MLVVCTTLSYGTFFLLKSYFDHLPKPSRTVSAKHILPVNPTQNPISILKSTKGLITAALSTREVNGLAVTVNQITACNGEKIKVYTSITDQAGKVVDDLRPTDFALFLDGQKLDNTRFSKVDTRDLPLSVMIALDHSGSMRGEPLGQAKKAAIDFLSNLKSSDQASVIQFDDVVELLQVLGPVNDQTLQVINNIEARGNTALLDTVGIASENIPICGRKAVVLLTDGKDTSSRFLTIDQALSKANRANVPVFVVGLRSSQFSPDVLQKIGLGSGGGYFEADRPADLLAIYQKISDQIKGQYLFEFDLEKGKQSGEHRIRLNSKIPGMVSSESSSEKGFIVQT